MINLQFARANTVTGKIIRWFSHGQWSHVDVVLEDGRLLGSQDCAMERGIQAGVQIRPADYVGNAQTLRVGLDMSVGQAFQFGHFLNEQLGKPYDWTSIASFATHRDWRDDEAWDCAELIAAALEKCGYFKYQLAAPVNKVTPQDLLLCVSVNTEVP